MALGVIYDYIYNSSNNSCGCFILMVMGGLESYDPKSDNKGFVSNNISDLASKDEIQKTRKLNLNKNIREQNGE